MSQHGDIHWTELVTNDVDSARNFYTTLFGWGLSTVPMPNGAQYTIFNIDDTPVVGMLPLSCTTAPQGTPNHWFTYFAVDNIETACKAAVESGGTVVREPFVVPGVGTHAILAAADGSHLGVIQPEN